MSPFGWLHRLVESISAWQRLVIWSAFVIIVAAAIWLLFPEWMTLNESGSVTIRNLVLAVAALIALPLALWRSFVAQQQAETAQQQAETAQRGLLNERYQKGSEMLGSSVLTVRLGGIYALRRLAEEHPIEYHLQVMRLFCAFAQKPTMENSDEAEQTETGTEPSVGNHGDDQPVRLRQDVEAVMEAISTRDEKRVEIERKAYPSSSGSPTCCTDRLRGGIRRGRNSFGVSMGFP